MKNFNPVIIKDSKRIDKLIKVVSTSVLEHTNNIKKEYEKIFGSFEIQALKELISQVNKKEWLFKKYLEKNKIVSFPGNIDKLVSSGNISEPDFSLLLHSIDRFVTFINLFNLFPFISDISELFSTEDNTFQLSENSKVMKRIIEKNSFETCTDAENIFANELIQLAGTYSKFVNDYKMININQIPCKLFTFIIEENGSIHIDPKIDMLKLFRKRSSGGKKE